MIHLTLSQQSERILPENNFFPGAFGNFAALDSQQRTFTALASGEAGIVLNTYATGSGKTKAALLYLHELAKHRDNCLFIAPTNELLRQHAFDIDSFCKEGQIDYQVLPLTKTHMDGYAREIAQIASGKPRRSAALEKLLDDPRRLEDTNGQPARPQQPYILVTNPDLFYYAVFQGYGRLEERSVMKQFITKFRYIVIDEFHYYNPKQLANFLFFLKLWQKFGYFEAGAKVCLLSATPNQEVHGYLQSLGVPLTEISPDSEPEDPAEKRIPSLAPADLTVYANNEMGTNGLIDLVMQYLPVIKERLAAGQQGAIISGALWQINLIYDLLLRSGIEESRVGRITGPQSPQDRAEATKRDLILATPTVDLGYNFDRPGKTRQSIDFLFFDAAFAAEFVQRLGRAGRVLGKPEADIPSTVIALVPPAISSTLQPLADRTISRAELRSAFRAALQNRTLSERSAIFDYIASGAIGEAFLPILRLYDMGGEEVLPDLQDLFDQLCELFRAPSYMHFASLRCTTRQYVRDDQLFRSAPTESHALFKHLIEKQDDMALRAWLEDASGGQKPNPKSAGFAQVKRELLRPTSKARDGFQSWMKKAQQRYAIRSASFQFRDSFQGPMARIYNPSHHLSDDAVRDFDALHIIQNCAAEFLDAAQWSSRSGSSPASDEHPVALYAHIRDLLPPENRLRLAFRGTYNCERKEWEEDHVCWMTALLDLELTTEQGQLPQVALQMLKAQYLPAFIAPYGQPIGGQLMGMAADYGLRWYHLEVTFATGSPQRYVMMLGTAALLAAARLRQQSAIYHKRQAASDHDPIWC